MTRIDDGRYLLAILAGEQATLFQRSQAGHELVLPANLQLLPRKLGVVRRIGLWCLETNKKPRCPDGPAVDRRFLAERGKERKTKCHESEDVSGVGHSGYVDEIGRMVESKMAEASDSRNSWRMPTGKQRAIAAPGKCNRCTGRGVT